MMYCSYHRLAEFITWTLELLDKPEPEIERAIINLVAFRHNLMIDNDEQRAKRAGAVSNEWIPRRR